MTLKELFPHIMLLTLDRRIDQALMLIKHIKHRFSIDVEMFLAGDGKIYAERCYDHIDVPYAAPRLPGSSYYPTWLRPNCYNAFLCQKKMIDRAKQKGYPQVLLLEDDMFFEEHTEAVLEKLDKPLRQLSWDLLYVGFCAPEYRVDLNQQPAEPFIISAGRCCGGFHCIGINASAYDKILALEPLGPLDALVDTFDNRYVIVPKLGEQKPGYSYVEQVVFTRPECQVKLDKVRKVWPDA